MERCGDRVSVWLARPEPGPPHEHAALLALLAPEDRARYARLRRPAARVAFLHAHALLSLALSRWAAHPPRAWRLARDARGRPCLAAPADAARLQLSLSHADGLVACALSARGPLGVDVERSARVRAPLAVAARCFAADEQRALAALPASRQAERFLDCWTVKEAFAKASGVGLAAALAGVCVDDVRDGRPRVRFAAPLEDDPARWQFALREPLPGSRLALAVALGGARELAISVREATHLAAAALGECELGDSSPRSELPMETA